LLWWMRTEAFYPPQPWRRWMAKVGCINPHLRATADRPKQQGP